MKLNSPNLLLLSLLLSLLLALTTQAQAQQPEEKANTCPNWQAKQLPTSPQQWQAEYQRLQPLFTTCLHSADFLAYYGAIELRTGRINSALDTLERALLLNPQHGAAQMDYAQALYYHGDPYAAQSLNKSLLNNPSLPPVIRQQIQTNQKHLHNQLNTFSHQLSLNTGYDSNLNTSPSINQLTLTLDGEEWLVALAEGLEPRSGAVMRLGASTRYTQRQATSRRTYQLSLNSRLSENSQDHQHQLSARYQQHNQLINGSQLNHQLSLIGLQHGNQHTFTTLEAQQHWQPANPQPTQNSSTCQLQAGQTLGYQSFPNRNNLNALEYRLNPSLQCNLNTSQISLTAGLMYNHALSNQRAGKHRQGQELTLYWQTPLAQGRLQAQASYTQWQDAKGYNPTLANNAPRQVQRRQLTLAYLLPLSPNLLLTTQAALQKQSSNIELFNYSSHQLDLGINWQF